MPLTTAVLVHCLEQLVQINVTQITRIEEEETGK